MYHKHTYVYKQTKQNKTKEKNKNRNKDNKTKQKSTVNYILQPLNYLYGYITEKKYMYNVYNFKKKLVY